MLSSAKQFLRNATALVAVAFVLSGCVGPFAPKQDLRTPGGSAAVNPPIPVTTKAPTVVNGSTKAEGVPSATLNQSDNPAAMSNQDLSFEKETTVTFPTPSSVTTETTKPDGGMVVVTETFPAGTIKKESVKQGAKQTIGAAQKDMVGETVAKLASFKWISYVGIVVLLGAAAMFHPAVRLAVGGGKSTQMGVALAGLVLIFGPAVVVGHESLILIAVAVGLLLWWLHGRLSYKEAAHDALKEAVEVPKS